MEAALTIGIRFAATAETIDPVWAVYSNRCLDIRGIRRDVDVSGRILAVWGGAAFVEAVLAIGMRLDRTAETIDPVRSAHSDQYLDVQGIQTRAMA